LRQNISLTVLGFTTDYWREGLHWGLNNTVKNVRELGEKGILEGVLSLGREKGTFLVNSPTTLTSMLYRLD